MGWPEMKDNQGNIDQLFKQQKELVLLDQEIQESEEALKELVDLYSEAKGKIAEYLAENFDKAQDNTKSSAGMDVFMLWAASQRKDLAEAYGIYIRLSKKAQIHTAILDSKGRRLSGMQTQTKIFDWRRS